jgi:hypothetical protein
MRVGIIGGVERNRGRYEQLARAAGCEVEFHHGHMNGRGPADLRSLVARCDVVVIITSVNSHGAVRLARQLLRKQNREPVIVQRFGICQFETMLGLGHNATPRSACAALDVAACNIA